MKPKCVKSLKVYNLERLRRPTGLDDLPARFIRDGAEGIAYPISYIIDNLSLKTGVVPDEMTYFINFRFPYFFFNRYMFDLFNRLYSTWHV